MGHTATSWQDVCEIACVTSWWFCGETLQWQKKHFIQPAKLAHVFPDFIDGTTLLTDIDTRNISSQHAAIDTCAKEKVPDQICLQIILKCRIFHNYEIDKDVVFPKCLSLFLKWRRFGISFMLNSHIINQIKPTV